MTKFAIIPKNENDIIRCEQPGKQTFFKLNCGLPSNLEDWEIKPHSGSFEHDAYCRNKCPIEDRIFDFDIMNKRDATAIRKKIYTFFGGHGRGVSKGVSA